MIEIKIPKQCFRVISSFKISHDKKETTIGTVEKIKVTETRLKFEKDKNEKVNPPMLRGTKIKDSFLLNLLFK